MSDKVLTIMQMVMRTAAKIARERPDFGLDPNLPLCRREHPEWFEDTAAEQKKPQ
jgi:hypothetical protein